MMQWFFVYIWYEYKIYHVSSLDWNNSYFYIYKATPSFIIFSCKVQICTKYKTMLVCGCVIIANLHKIQSFQDVNFIVNLSYIILLLKNSWEKNLIMNLLPTFSTKQWIFIQMNYNGNTQILKVLEFVYSHSVKVHTIQKHWTKAT